MNVIEKLQALMRASQCVKSATAKVLSGSFRFTRLSLKKLKLSARVRYAVQGIVAARKKGEAKTKK